MKLRCIVSPNKKIIVGERYEVVEILELPDHAMVRRPDGKWPKPGEPYFGLHADEYFESPREGIPALSCGYNYSEQQFFGVIIPNSLYPTPPRRKLVELSPQLESLVNAVEKQGQPDLWSLTHYDVWPKVCWPERLERSFILVGFRHENLGRRLSYRSAANAIKAVMRMLRISATTMPKAEDQQLEFWARSWKPSGPWRWKSPTSFQPGRR